MEAKTILDLHTIRSPVRGVIKAFYVQPGEAFRELEPVLLIRVSRPRGR